MEPPTSVPAPATSLVARMFNVFATPGEVFDEVRHARPSTANWLVPTLLAIVMGTISVLIIFSQPAIVQKIHEQQTKVLEDKVKNGQMTQAQADQAEAMIEKFGGPTMLKLTSSVSVVVGSFVAVFWRALVIWLLGKWFLKASFPYQQALEVAGLVSMISILGAIVTCLLTVLLGKTVSVSLALLVNDFNPQNLAHMCLAAVNFFDLWLTGVMAIGLARLAGATWAKALALTAAYWLVMECLLISLGWLAVMISHGFK